MAFESAIVPKWGASTITFKNVYVSRRPQEDDEDDEDMQEGEGHPASSAILNAIQSKIGHHPDQPSQGQGAPPKRALSRPRETSAEKSDRLKRDNNYTMFDLNFEEIDVTFSLPRWLDGKGLVQDAIIKGVRGVIDRRHVWWDTSVPLKPEDFRHETRLGDFELESLDVEDFLVTVYQPGGQRPFNVSLFNASIGLFRKRWMFFDLMSADAIVGQYDNCLFSLHKPQKLGKSSQEEKDERIKRLARFRIDGLPIEHAQYATGFQGPMSWLTAGKVDAVLDIKFPRHPDEEVDINAILNQIGRNVAEIAKATGGMNGGEEGEASGITSADTTTAAVEAAQHAIASIKDETEDREVIPGQHLLARPALRPPDLSPRQQQQHQQHQERQQWQKQQQRQQRQGLSSELQGDDVKLRERQVKIDIDLRFRDIKAAVPMYTTDLSVSNNAFIRPIVAFMNANRTLIPIHCTVNAPLSDFDGSWTMYAALVYHVSSSAANQQRMRTVGVWGVQRGAEAVLNVVRAIVDPMHADASTPYWIRDYTSRNSNSTLSVQTQANGTELVMQKNETELVYAAPVPNRCWCDLNNGRLLRPVLSGYRYLDDAASLKKVRRDLKKWREARDKSKRALGSDDAPSESSWSNPFDTTRSSQLSDAAQNPSSHWWNYLSFPTRRDRRQTDPIQQASRTEAYDPQLPEYPTYDDPLMEWDGVGPVPDEASASATPAPTSHHQRPTTPLLSSAASTWWSSLLRSHYDLRVHGIGLVLDFGLTRTEADVRNEVLEILDWEDKRRGRVIAAEEEGDVGEEVSASAGTVYESESSGADQPLESHTSTHASASTDVGQSSWQRTKRWMADRRTGSPVEEL
ncbi:hypothetical protein QFC19_004230 [Naganishia cerealis]|uniref:Uncharacterized protein n=1 Tax=Naganishia cerealis TaxID=610337 RepID=A0ACC2VX43_9TREE|nr:hypothetical protein QFC19_004230 [Naganishia cerealis]